MSKSALLGQPPNTYYDKLIFKGLHEISPSSINPDKRYPLGPPVAANASHKSRAPGMIVGVSFAIALVILVTCSRLYTRKFRKRAFGADDLVIIPGAIGCVGYLSLIIAQATVGCLGKHLYDCTYHEVGWFAVLAKCNFPIFYFTIFTIKISITLLNRRITGMTSRRWQIAHWTYLGVVCSLLPICVFLSIFTCSPTATFFTIESIAELPDPRVVKCLDANAISLAARISHIVTDWLLLPVPLVIIWRLQMPLSKRLRLMAIFCFGFISSIAAVLWGSKINRATTDLTYDYHTIYALDIVDIFFATIVASLPALNGVLDTFLATTKNWMLSTTETSRSKFRTFAPRFWGSRDYSTHLSGRGTNAIFNNWRKPTKHQLSQVETDETYLQHELDVELHRIQEGP